MSEMHVSLIEALDKAGIEHTTIELTDEYLLSRGIDPVEYWAKREANNEAVIEFFQMLKYANENAGKGKTRYG